VSEIGIKRFAARYTEHYRSENYDGMKLVGGKHFVSINRVKGAQDLGMLNQFRNPRVAITPNQIAITGPNTFPMSAVPRCCEKKSKKRIVHVRGKTTGVATWVATPRPSTAERTVIAGVITPSPARNAAPRIPPPMANARVRGDILFASCNINPMRAKIPPSPSLSARRKKITYLMLTTMIRDQKISDMTP